MKKTLTLILFSTCFSVEAVYTKTERTYDGNKVILANRSNDPREPINSAIVYRPVSDNGISDNYIDTSGFFSSPESVREYGAIWATNATVLLQRFSDDVPVLAANSVTNETAAAELRKIYEFLLSPKSLYENQKHIMDKKAEVLANGHIAASTNKIEGIAKALDFTLQRRYVWQRVERSWIVKNTENNGTFIYFTQESWEQSENRNLEAVESVRTNYFYKPRSESDFFEQRVLEPFMNEIFYIERYLFKMLINEFTKLRENNSEGLSELVDQVAQIADISEKGVLMLREAAGLNPDGTPKESNGSSE